MYCVLFRHESYFKNAPPFIVYVTDYGIQTQRSKGLTNLNRSHYIKLNCLYHSHFYCVNNSPICAHVGGQRKCEERKKRDVYQRNYSILLEPVGQGGEGERWISGQQEGNVLYMDLANFMTSVDFEKINIFSLNSIPSYTCLILVILVAFIRFLYCLVDLNTTI